MYREPDNSHIKTTLGTTSVSRQATTIFPMVHSWASPHVRWAFTRVPWNAWDGPWGALGIGLGLGRHGTRGMRVGRPT